MPEWEAVSWCGDLAVLSPARACPRSPMASPSKPSFHPFRSTTDWHETPQQNQKNMKSRML